MSQLRRYSQSRLPTEHGEFAIVVFSHGDDEHVALVHGDVDGSSDLLCRVHSECLTGEVFGSLRCDCRAQLKLALELIAREGKGVVVYLRQEGRGIGLGNKILAYARQDQGEDTVTANESLGFAPDERDYENAAAILRTLGVKSVRLMTNNPDKATGLAAHGIKVAKRVAHWAGESEHNKDYLEVKRTRMGHIAVTRDGDTETGD